MNNGIMMLCKLNNVLPEVLKELKILNNNIADDYLICLIQKYKEYLSSRNNISNLIINNASIIAQCKEYNFNFEQFNQYLDCIEKIKTKRHVGTYYFNKIITIINEKMSNDKINFVSDLLINGFNINDNLLKKALNTNFDFNCLFEIPYLDEFTNPQMKKILEGIVLGMDGIHIKIFAKKKYLPYNEMNIALKTFKKTKCYTQILYEVENAFYKTYDDENIHYIKKFLFDNVFNHYDKIMNFLENYNYQVISNIISNYKRNRYSTKVMLKLYYNNKNLPYECETLANDIHISGTSQISTYNSVLNSLNEEQLYILASSHAIKFISSNGLLEIFNSKLNNEKLKILLDRIYYNNKKLNINHIKDMIDCII